MRRILTAIADFFSEVARTGLMVAAIANAIYAAPVCYLLFHMWRSSQLGAQGKHAAALAWTMNWLVYPTFVVGGLFALFVAIGVFLYERPWLKQVMRPIRWLMILWFAALATGLSATVLHAEWSQTASTLLLITGLLLLGVEHVFLQEKMRGVGALVLGIMFFGYLARIVDWHQDVWGNISDLAVSMNPWGTKTFEEAQAERQALQKGQHGVDQADAHAKIVVAGANNQIKTDYDKAVETAVAAHKPIPPKPKAYPAIPAEADPKATPELAPLYLVNTDGRFPLVELHDQKGWRHYALTNVEGNTCHITWREGSGRGNWWIERHDNTRSAGEEFPLHFDEFCCHDEVCEGTPGCWLATTPNHGLTRMYP